MQNSLLEMPEEDITATDEVRQNSCRTHRWANRQEDFIEVTIRKTGKKIIRCRYCEHEKIEQKKIRTVEWQKEKDDLTDYYVRKTLTTGKNAIRGQPVPEVLIEAQRAVIQLKRLKEKMDEPLKTCNAHGKLFQEDVIKAGNYKSGNPRWRCRKCMKDMHAKHYELHKAKVLIAHANYRKENPETVKQSKRKSWLIHKEKYLEKENARRAKYKALNPEKYKAMENKRVHELHDSYVKKCITKRSSILKSADIPPSLVECARALLKLKRGLREQIESDKLLTLEEKLYD